MGGSSKPGRVKPPPVLKDEADAVPNAAGASQRLLAGLGFKKNFLSPRGPGSDATWGKPDTTTLPTNGNPSGGAVADTPIDEAAKAAAQTALDAENRTDTISQHSIGVDPETAVSTKDEDGNWRLNPEGGRRYRVIY